MAAIPASDFNLIADSLTKFAMAISDYLNDTPESPNFDNLSASLGKLTTLAANWEARAAQVDFADADSAAATLKSATSKINDATADLTARSATISKAFAVVGCAATFAVQLAKGPGGAILTSAEQLIAASR